MEVQLAIHSFLMIQPFFQMVLFYLNDYIFIFIIKNAVDRKWLSACPVVDPLNTHESVGQAAEFPPTVPSLSNIFDDSAALSYGTVKLLMLILFCNLFIKTILISMPRW